MKRKDFTWMEGVVQIFWILDGDFETKLKNVLFGESGYDEYTLPYSDTVNNITVSLNAMTFSMVREHLYITLYNFGTFWSTPPPKKYKIRSIFGYSLYLKTIAQNEENKILTMKDWYDICKYF